jgi:DNA-directed RNA polymerase specialized sigma24 family protein
MKSDPPPEPSIGDALRSPELLELLPDLVAYTERQSRYLRGRRPTVDEVQDAMQDALVAALAGRTWRKKLGLRAHLSGVLWSVISHHARSAKRRRTAPMEDAPEPVAPTCQPVEVIYAGRRLQVVWEDVSHDAELRALYEVWEDGAETCEEQALALGWDLRRVMVARRRLQRRARRTGPP